jgi:hypothetical protein
MIRVGDMKKSRYITLILIAGMVFLILLAGCTGKGKGDPKVPSEEKSETGQTTEAVPKAAAKTPLEISEGVLFEWEVAVDTLVATISAPTTGWVSVGFNPTKMMQDANFILAYVADGEVFIRDDFGTRMTSHDSDISQGGDENVTLLGGSEEDGITSVTFSIPLKSGDTFDGEIRLSDETTVLFAYGNKDDFDSMHKWRGKEAIIFGE